MTPPVRLLLLLAATACYGSSLVAQVTWNRFASARSISAITLHAVAHDTPRRRPANSPPARSGHVQVFDEARARA